jgi:hypothetical protein
MWIIQSLIMANEYRPERMNDKNISHTVNTNLMVLAWSSDRKL